jgi:hypothetical protein
VALAKLTLLLWMPRCEIDLLLSPGLSAVDWIGGNTTDICRGPISAAADNSAIAQTMS